MNKNKDISLLRTYSSKLTNVPNWDRLEKKLNFRFPNDYKAFIDRYGATTWGDIDSGEEISILSPFSRISHLSLFDLGLSLLEGYKESFILDLQRIPFQYELKPGGFLPWLLTSNGDIAYMLIMDGQMDGSSIIFQMSRAARYEIYVDLSCGEFCYRIAARKLQSGILPPIKIIE